LGLGDFIRENHFLAPVPTQHGLQLIVIFDEQGPVRATPRRFGPDVERGDNMAAMKPRTGDGPLEVTKEGRGIVMRVPLEGGGRLVVEMTPDEATALGEALRAAVG
jgi:hypothetical protein